MADKLPPALKGIQPFIAISKQFAKRDPVIAYYGKIELLSDDIQILLYNFDVFFFYTIQPICMRFKRAFVWLGVTRQLKATS